MATALISVSDKTGLVPFVKKLISLGYTIMSSGGTAKLLLENGCAVEEVSHYTDFPEMMGGRVKTLHPKIFGGILARRDNPIDQEEVRKNAISLIDLVVVNLYPFQEKISQPNCSYEEAIENIDIGGPSLIRAAAKNHASVAVLTSPLQYEEIVQELEEHGSIQEEKRKILARKAFEHTAHYDSAIASWMRQEQGAPELLNLYYEKVRSLRYGENPHQKAAFFRNPNNNDANVTNARVLHGKELSFNNIVDANSALELVKEFELPAVVFIKHNNPCGVAQCDDLEIAFDLAFTVDTQSAFGSVIALNRPVTKNIAEYINKHKIFVELIICPYFEKDALAVLMKRPNIRLLETGTLALDTEKRDIKKVAGGILVQTANTFTVSRSNLKVVTQKKPSEQEIDALIFANIVCKHVMSNAIVFAKSSSGCQYATGIGAGQMSRVDSVWIAAHKGGEKVPGSVMASDAFFPFPDAVEEAAKAGVTAIISPGGSIRDEEVIATAERLGVAMIFTGVRMFRH